VHRGSLVRAAFLALVLAFLAQTGTAHALECGTSLVIEGDTTAHVLASCGQPDSIVTLPARSYRGSRGTPTELWTYDFGPTRDRIAITIRNGCVVRFDAAGRGRPQPSARGGRAARRQ
jgi:hypothetical protein